MKNKKKQENKKIKDKPNHEAQKQIKPTIKTNVSSDVSTNIDFLKNETGNKIRKIFKLQTCSIKV